MLAYARTWHTRHPGIFRTFPYLHPDEYSESCHIYEKFTYIQNSDTFKIQCIGKHFFKMGL